MRHAEYLEKTRLKRNNAKGLGIRKDNIKMELKETGYYSEDKAHQYLEKAQLHILSPRQFSDRIP